ncbi:nicotinic acid mononucleotide adenylyltransferase [Williamsoniiplasma luminosum]|uniref:Probable nicotinate-nucleotide adenylyltransferase n=1 Tax=Williamsoniiplasma luminosum TaxID=214888 RepID=A0A2K8NUS7_9MOLU|nr:nicotinate-nucleotide adenylyltransferase [Williamsoniiplasma luminosum]ATZ17296.1 nicotinic acid mononucleotide adenylyltransferase [Williamsoniiplasma luminosum]
MNKKKIALFGGSFDPIHTDHVNIAKTCYEKLGFEEVWFIPAYLNPFKKAQLSSIKDRLAMLRIVEEKYDFIRINQYEISNNRPTSTFETLSYIIKHYPDNDFAFIMGSDQLDTFEQWSNFNQLIKIMPFKVFLRDEKNFNQEIVKKYALETFTFNNNFLSSTDIRQLKNLNKQIPKINEYINFHLLYLPERMGGQMDEARYQHSINVGKMAQKLAVKWGADENKALVAGTLHDIAKCWTREKNLWYLEHYLPFLIEEPFPIWHSFTGMLHLEKDWLIKDQEILQAVFNHTVGSIDMSLLDKIVFCADKISLERDYDEVETMRKLCFEDIEQGFIALVKMQYEQAIKKHGPNSIGLLLTNTYNYFVKGEKD